MPSAIKSDSSQTIDVIIVIDGDAVRVLSGPSSDPQRPSPISTAFFRVITTWNNIVPVDSSEIEDPGSDFEAFSGLLSIHTSSGDMLRWRIVTNAVSMDYTALLLKLVGPDGATNPPPLIGVPEAYSTQFVGVLPNPDDPWSPTPSVMNDFYYQTDVRELGTSFLTWWIALYAKDALIGYYYFEIKTILKPLATTTGR